MFVKKKVVVIAGTPQTGEVAEEISSAEDLEIRVISGEEEAINVLYRSSEAIVVESRYKEISALLYMAAFLKPEPYIFILKEIDDEFTLPENRPKIVLIETSAESANIARLVRLHLASALAEPDIRLESNVTESLIEGGAMPWTCGFQYLCDAVKLYIHNKFNPCSLQKDIYEKIAQNRSCTINQVKRGIRDTVKTIWEQSSHQYRLDYFGSVISSLNKRPTPKQFIATVAYKISREL